MTDHLEEAAARCVQLASAITDDGCEPNRDLSVRVAMHLTLVAGLIRGGLTPTRVEFRELDPARYMPEAERVPSADEAAALEVEELRHQLGKTTTDPREAARNFRISAEAMSRNSHQQPNWAAGVAHGYRMAADALDEVADAVEEPGPQLWQLQDELAKMCLRWRHDAELRHELWRLMGVPATTDDELVERVRNLIAERDAFANAAEEVAKYWTGWTSERREGVRALSQFVHASVEQLVVIVRERIWNRR